jgi:uncharacterized protein YggE
MLKLTALLLLLTPVAALSADDVPHTISVTGFGSVEVRPDRATLNLSIVAREPTVAAAQEQAAEVTARVLALTEDLDIPGERVDTMTATVQPNYRWNRDTESQELIGYVAQRQMRIELHDLDRVGVVIERAVEAGVNQVAPPRLSSSRDRDAYRDALEAAADDARENAGRLAAALGLQLGEAVQVTTNAPGRPPVPLMRTTAMAVEADAGETYNAGDLTVTATVSVVFETSN